jgi:hypothetical protein
VPALGHPSARELYLPLVERCLQFEQQEALFEIQNSSHRHYVSGRSGARGQLERIV